MQISLISENSIINFLVGEETENGLVFLWNFFLIFEGKIENETKINFTDLQELTEDKLEKAEIFLNTYNKYNPELKNIILFLKKIKYGKYFYISLGTIDIQKINKYQLKLFHYNKNYNSDSDMLTAYNKDLEKLTQVENTFYNHFDIFLVAPEKKIRIGESDKTKRICKFCKLGKEHGKTFQKEAHAIPEGFGNKYIINNEECDDCNEKFGNTIESEFLKSLDFFRVFYKIKGKKGPLKIPFKGGEIEDTNDGIEIRIDSSKIISDENNIPKSFEVEMHHKISLMNLYRALAKFAIGVLNNNILPNFSKTIDWINGNDAMSKLPKVAVSINTYNHFETANITIFTRRNDNDNTRPYCFVELKSKGLAFIYLLPTFSDLDNESTFEDFLESINKNRNIKWSLWDMNEETHQKLALDIKMNKEYS